MLFGLSLSLSLSFFSACAEILDSPEIHSTLEHTRMLAHVHSSSIWMRSAWSGTVNSNNPIFLICACVSSFFRQINVKRFRMHFTQKRDANLRGIRLKISIQARITSNSIDWERISESRRNEAEKTAEQQQHHSKLAGGVWIDKRQQNRTMKNEKWKQNARRDIHLHSR